MCVDYIDLNKTCPNDAYPFPRIDQLVDSTSGDQFLSFMDAYSKYNKIKMLPGDEEHTTFFSDNGIICCKVMSFGLKNVGATYQRLVNLVFKEQLGRLVEAYIYDMIVMSKTSRAHLIDLQEVFHH